MRVYSQEPALILPEGHAGQVNSARFSNDNKKVLTAADDATAKLWDVNTGRQLANLKGHTGEVLFAAFSPDDRSILTSSDEDFHLQVCARAGRTQQGRPAMQTGLYKKTIQILIYSAAAYTSGKA